MPPIIVADTGFILSVASIDALPPQLGGRWAGRTAWPKEVHSELQHRDRNPGQGVPAGLARRAANSAPLWLPDPIELDDAQTTRARAIATHLGGPDDLSHWGEAAATVVAQDVGGTVATEDYKAARFLQASCGVTITCVSEVLQRLHADGLLSVAEVDTALNELRAKGRPNVDAFTGQDIIDGHWRGRLTRTR